MVTKQDLADPSNDGDWNVMLRCPNECGARYSANINDYYVWDDDEEFKCDECDELLELVRRSVIYERL